MYAIPYKVEKMIERIAHGVAHSALIYNQKQEEGGTGKSIDVFGVKDGIFEGDMSHLQNQKPSEILANKEIQNSLVPSQLLVGYVTELVTPLFAESTLFKTFAQKLVLGAGAQTVSVPILEAIGEAQITSVADYVASAGEGTGSTPNISARIADNVQNTQRITASAVTTREEFQQIEAASRISPGSYIDMQKEKILLAMREMIRRLENFVYDGDGTTYSGFLKQFGSNVKQAYAAGLTAPTTKWDATGAEGKTIIQNDYARLNAELRKNKVYTGKIFVCPISVASQTAFVPMSKTGGSDNFFLPGLKTAIREVSGQDLTIVDTAYVSKDVYLIDNDSLNMFIGVTEQITFLPEYNKQGNITQTLVMQTSGIHCTREGAAVKLLDVIS